MAMWWFNQLGPCENATYSLQLVIALGVIINTALGTWLAHRRRIADIRDNGGKVHGPSQAEVDLNRRRQREFSDSRDDGPSS